MALILSSVQCVLYCLFLLAVCYFINPLREIWVAFGRATTAARVAQPISTNVYSIFVCPYNVHANFGDF